jgi:hypothetical protein
MTSAQRDINRKLRILKHGQMKGNVSKTNYLTTIFFADTANVY